MIFGKHSTNKQSGFSLQELIVALAIAAAIVSIGVPGFNSTLNKQRLLAATDEVVSTLHLARSEAARRQGYVTICPSADGVGCRPDSSNWRDGWIVVAKSAETNLGRVEHDDEVIHARPAMHSTIGMSSIGGIVGSISFRPDGTIGAPGAGGTITVCDDRGDAAARGIVVQASGEWSVSRDRDHAGNLLACRDHGFAATSSRAGAYAPGQSTAD